MKQLFLSLLKTSPSSSVFNVTMLCFRVLVAVEMILVHGLKKIGAETEIVPNPLHLPEVINQSFATAADLILPLFVIAGLFTRFAVIVIVAVPLTGYFIVHGHDSLVVRDVPFMYSLSYLLILLLGSGRYSIDYLISKRPPSLN